MRSACRANGQELFLHLEHYIDRMGVVPPAATRDGLGRPIQIWQAVVLNSADYADPIPGYNSARPWYEPVDRSASASDDRMFDCPNTQGYAAPCLTNDSVIVDGDECSLDFCGPGGPRGPWPVVVEVPEPTIEWTESRDVSPSEIASDAMARDPRGFLVIDSDGKIRRLSRAEILDGWSRGKAALCAAKSPGR